MKIYILVAVDRDGGGGGHEGHVFPGRSLQHRHHFPGSYRGRDALSSFGLNRS